jgi:hypothetical protein
MRSLMTLALMLSFVVAACVSKPVETPAAHPEPTLAQIQQNIDKLKNDDEIHWPTPGKFIDPTAQKPQTSNPYLTDSESGSVVAQFQGPTIKELLEQIEKLQKQLIDMQLEELKKRFERMTPDEREELSHRLSVPFNQRLTYDAVHKWEKSVGLEIKSRIADVTCLQDALQKKDPQWVEEGYWIIRSLGKDGPSVVVRPDDSTRWRYCNIDPGLGVGDKVVLRREEIPGEMGYEPDPKLKAWVWVAKRP